MTPYVKGLHTQLDRITAKINAAKERCQHANVKKIPHGDTGNYDPHNDHYWYECHCPDCNKRWTEPQ